MKILTSGVLRFEKISIHFEPRTSDSWSEAQASVVWCTGCCFLSTLGGKDRIENQRVRQRLGKGETRRFGKWGLPRPGNKRAYGMFTK